MGRPPEQAHCRKCGNPCPRRGHYDKGWQCIDCAVATYEEATRQIQAGEGEYYEKWLAGLAAAIAKKQQQLADAVPVGGSPQVRMSE